MKNKSQNIVFLMLLLLHCSFAVVAQVDNGNNESEEQEFVELGPETSTPSPKGFKVDEIDLIPCFKGCEHITDSAESLQCTKIRLMQKATRVIRYREMIYKERIHDTEEKNKITVRVDSTVIGPSITHKYSSYWGEAPELYNDRVNGTINWVPGVKDGKDVDVSMEFSLPVKLPIPYDIPDDYFESQYFLQDEGNIDYASEVFALVEKMPYPFYPECKEGPNHFVLKKCVLQKLGAFIRTRLEVPYQAKVKKIEGKILIAFTVELDGTLSNPEIIKGLDGGWNEEVIRLIEQMNVEGLRWKPGQQDGQDVRTRVNYLIVCRKY